MATNFNVAEAKAKLSELLDRALTEPRLLRTPLVRIDNRVTIGHSPDEWQAQCLPAK